jgi:ribonuclease BN (tRNA processing enzyme)
MPYTVEFIGSGDAFGSGGRCHTCLLVRGGREGVLIDCGAAAPVALQQRGVALTDIGLVLLSHLHGDHFGGVPLLLLDAVFNRPRRMPLVIAGPRGCETRVMAALDVLFPGTTDAVAARAVARFADLEPFAAATFGDVTVTAVPVRHSRSIECFALRLELSGRVLTYSGDTEWTPALVEASRDADLFICECSTFERPVPGHLSHSVLEAHAGELTAARIVLTHAGPEMLDRRDGGRWPVADDGLVLTV